MSLQKSVTAQNSISWSAWSILILLCILGFFSRPWTQGLFFDAALYAGLAQSIACGGDPWLLTMPPAFELFFEHPPFFFAWGAWVLQVFGDSDFAARLIGALPGAFGFLIWHLWVARRFGVARMLASAVLLVTFAHYLKFSATVMLEAPLSLAAAMAVIGVFEIHRSPQVAEKVSSRDHLLGFLALFFGLMLMVLVKGIAVAPLLFGLALFVLVAGLKPQVNTALRDSFVDKAFIDKKKFGLAAFVMLVMLLAVALGFLAWYLGLFYISGSEQASDYWNGYWRQQVWRSFTTDRGLQEMHPGWQGIGITIFKYGWPWWWLVPLTWIRYGSQWVPQGALWTLGKFFPAKARRTGSQSGHRLPDELRLYLQLSAILTLGGLSVFAFSKTFLPHYLHVFYLPWSLVAVIGFHRLGVGLYRLLSRWPRAANMSLAVMIVVVMLSTRGVSRSADRGQEWIAWRAELMLAAQSEQRSALDQGAAEVLVYARPNDLYYVTAFSSWYLGRWKWRVVSDHNGEFLRGNVRVRFSVGR